MMMSNCHHIDDHENHHDHHYDDHDRSHIILTNQGFFLKGFINRDYVLRKIAFIVKSVFNETTAFKGLSEGENALKGQSHLKALDWLQTLPPVF